MAVRHHLPHCLHSRLVAKTLTWRTIGLATLFTLSLALTGSPVVSGTLTLAYHLVNTLLYYVHERAWERQGASLKAVATSIIAFAAFTSLLAWLTLAAP